MPDFRVIKGGANSTAKRKSVAGSKRVTEEQKRAANIAQGVSVPEITVPNIAPDNDAFNAAVGGASVDATVGVAATAAPFDASSFDAASFDQFNGEGDFASDAAGSAAAGAASGSAGAADAPASASGSVDSGKRRARPSVGTKSTASKVMTALLVVLTCIIAVVVIGFGWLRWLHGSDTQDIQGTWYVNGTEATMTFDEANIVLTDEVSYEYEIKPADKTIRYEFSHMSGVGSYRFSLDREMVAIFDGEASAMDTLKADFTWMLGAVFAAVQGQTASPAPADAENYTLLTRMPMAVVPEGSLAFPTLPPAEEADASTDAATDGGEATAAVAVGAAAAGADAAVDAGAAPEAAEE